MLKKKKILISAYAISPYLGSEYGVGWNFVSRLSDFYDITVLYGTSGEKIGNNSGMTKYLKERGAGDVNFIFVRPSKLVIFFDFLNHEVSPLFFTFAYYLWQMQVLSVAKNLVIEKRFELVHQLNTIGFRQPGFLWRLKTPFVWGPVGGSSNLNKIFFPLQSKGNFFRQVIRNWSNWYFLSCSPKIRKASRTASAIFCATRADQENFRKYLSVECPVIRENSIINRATSIKKTGYNLNLVWVGSVDDRKALPLLIDSLARSGYRDGWILNVVGDGPAKEKCMAMSIALGLTGNIVWHGNIKRELVLEIMRDADVHIITSVMDSNPTVLLEAFEMCVPTIALDHFGMSDLIDTQIGFKIEITTLDDIVKKLAECLIFCFNNHDVLDRMKSRILERQSELHWDLTIQKVRDIYEKVLAND